MGQNIFIQEQDEDIIIWSSKKGRESGGDVDPLRNFNYYLNFNIQ